MADRAAAAIAAKAYTIGTDLVFARDVYDPRSVSGMLLIAHELTHAAQQQATDSGDEIKHVDRVSLSNWIGQIQRDNEWLYRARLTREATDHLTRLNDRTVAKIAEHNWDSDRIVRSVPCFIDLDSELLSSIIERDWGPDKIQNAHHSLRAMDPPTARMMVERNWGVDRIDQTVRKLQVNRPFPEIVPTLIERDCTPNVIGQTVRRFGDLNLDPELARTLIRMPVHHPRRIAIAERVASLPPLTATNMIRGNWPIEQIERTIPVLRDLDTAIFSQMVFSRWRPERIRVAGSVLQRFDSSTARELIPQIDNWQQTDPIARSIPIGTAFELLHRDIVEQPLVLYLLQALDRGWSIDRAIERWSDGRLRDTLRHMDRSIGESALEEATTTDIDIETVR